MTDFSLVFLSNTLGKYFDTMKIPPNEDGWYLEVFYGCLCMIELLKMLSYIMWQIFNQELDSQKMISIAFNRKFQYLTQFESTT